MARIRGQSQGPRGRKAAISHYEFGGPIGAFGVTFGLPLVCYLFAFVCNDISGCPAPSLLHLKSLTLTTLKKDVGWPGFEGLLSQEAFLVTLGYYTLSLILWALLPAQEVDGTELSTGSRLKYRLNAYGSACVTLAIAIAASITYEPFDRPWNWIWDHYVQLLTSNVVIAFALAAFVYVRSFQVKAGGEPDGRLLAPGGTTGNLIYDFYIGRELNPPVTIPFIGTVDIKSFMELRPGMLGWMLLNLTSAVKQHSNYGRITDSIVLVCVTQAVYYVDAIWNEPAILTTMDITTDGFGYMLSFGDLVWVPFTYSLQARYLAVHPVDLGFTGCAVCLSVLGLGFYIFRSANSQKNRFRSDPTHPDNAGLESITTRTGSKLLVSGWWGQARHINYLGDWLLSWGYCLPTGIAGYIIQPSSPFRLKTPDGASFIRDDHSLRGGLEVIPGEARGWGMLITYFYMVYFAVLLIHRERRDDEKCHKKYGKDWEEYKRRVNSRIIPGVY